MKFRAIFAKTTTDKIKSRLISPSLGELVFECYMTPDQFAEMIKKYFEREFVIEIKEL